MRKLDCRLTILESFFFMSSLTFNLLSYNRQLRKTNQGNEWLYLHWMDYTWSLGIENIIHE